MIKHTMGKKTKDKVLLEQTTLIKNGGFSETDWNLDKEVAVLTSLGREFHIITMVPLWNVMSLKSDATQPMS